MLRRWIAQGIVVVGVALLLATAAIVHRTAMTQAAAHRNTPHNCYNIQLMITRDKSAMGLGHIALIYRLHDLWDRPCTLQGFPGLESLDRNFHSLPTHLEHNNGYLIADFPARQVQLDQRHDAYFALEYHDSPVGNEACPRARYLMIIPPNDRLPVVTFSRIIACGGLIDVSPVQSQPAW